MIVVHADTIEVRVEPHFIAVDYACNISGLTVRSAFTSDQARKHAAELLVAAEDADKSTFDGFAGVA